jgi:hypothetical protein
MAIDGRESDSYTLKYALVNLFYYSRVRKKPNRDSEERPVSKLRK